MSGWLKLLVGTAIAIPLGIVAFIWWLESAFTGSSCKDTIVDKGVLFDETTYQTLRLVCSGRDDQFTVMIGRGTDNAAAVTAFGGPKPELKQKQDRSVLFAVGGFEVRVELDDEGRPKTRTDVKGGKVVETMTYSY